MKKYSISFAVGMIVVGMVYKYHAQAQMPHEIRQEIARLEDQKNYLEGEIQFGEFQGPSVQEWRQEVQNLTERIKALKAQLP